MKIFKDGLEQAMPADGVSEADQQAILKAVTIELKKHVKFEKNGDAKALFKSHARIYYEWKGLGPRRIIARKLSQVDELNGVQGSYLVSLGADVYRSFDNKTKKWSPWHKGSSAFFPSNLQVVKSGGKFRVLPNTQLKSHVPTL